MSRVGGAGVLLVEVLVEVLHRGAGVLLHWSWIGIACKGFISCGGWQPPAERWNIIRHLDSHKLIVIAATWKNHNIAAAITSLLAASGYVIDVKSWERVECVIWSQIDYYQVSRVHNTLVQLLLFLIPSNSKQIDVPYCPILITIAIGHYFWKCRTGFLKPAKTNTWMGHKNYYAHVISCWYTGERCVFSLYWTYWREKSCVLYSVFLNTEYRNIEQRNKQLLFLKLDSLQSFIVLSPLGENGATCNSTTTSYKDCQKWWTLQDF